jgi:hypothetical protein
MLLTIEVCRVVVGVRFFGVDICVEKRNRVSRRGLMEVLRVCEEVDADVDGVEVAVLEVATLCCSCPSHIEQGRSARCESLTSRDCLNHILKFTKSG